MRCVGRLIYSMIVSLDGYVTDREGKFDWAVPDEEVLETINRDTAEASTYLYGRRMYEMMRVWETDPSTAAQSPRSAEFADMWVRAQKIVYSNTLSRVDTGLTRLERRFDPAEVARLKESTGGDLTIAGPTLASSALRENLVDQVHLLVCPVVVGGGQRALPDIRLHLRLSGLQRFSNGMIQLYYDCEGARR